MYGACGWCESESELCMVSVSCTSEYDWCMVSLRGMSEREWCIDECECMYDKSNAKVCVESNSNQLQN